MGMFDTILIHKTLIDSLLEKEWRSSLESEEDYYHFQTKCLENFLWTYFIEADKQIYANKHSYLEETDKPKEAKTKENITAEVFFYDGFITETEEIWLEFKATIIRGQLEEISIQDCKRIGLEVLKERSKVAEEWRKKREELWEMKVFRFFQNLEWKLSKIYKKLFGLKYFKFKNWLKDQADKKAGPFPNIYE
jgi:hypothetical protein